MADSKTDTETSDIVSSIISQASPNSKSDDKYSSATSTSSTNEETTTKASWIKDTAYDIVNNAIVTFNNAVVTVNKTTTEVYDFVSDVVSENYEEQTTSDRLNANSAESKFFNLANAAIDSVGDVISALGDWMDSTALANTGIGQTLTSIVKIVGNSIQDYQDGVSETTFGAYMTKSWAGNSATSFLDYFKSENQKSGGSYKINILKSTPLDSGTAREALFGSMILGTPYTFNNMADPNNRTLVNSLVKDCKIVSFTPGMPKYYGLQSQQDAENNIFKQTSSPNDMLTYLLRNGMDKTFSEKDKRYYTFEAKYKEYFAYLEAMLNPIWIKMGLAQGSDSKTFNIYSFFKIRSGNSDGGIDASSYQELLEQYNSSIGFYVNPASAVSESVSNSQTSTGSELAGNVNSASETYQRLNYITGMGTGSAMQATGRKIMIGKNAAIQLGSYLSDGFSTAKSLKSGVSSLFSGGGTITKAVGAAASLAAGAVGAAIDITTMSANEDLGNVVQQFATTNGLKVVYPELWSESGYSKNVNFNLSFVSPYGDPLSIFKYVYVPFCALLCLALPRQAAENGFVSPFFVRADIPGMFTTDLGLISDITWTKGGGNNLWTKDGLPRAIDCTISLVDLYPYLAMTKRMSFLSANPSYTVFLDNMAGMCALNDNTGEDPLNDYFKRLVNRVSGMEENGNKLWNTFSSAKQTAAYNTANATRSAVGKNIDTIPWLYNSSL